MIITIDGPAGAGKSSVARGLAARLGFEFLDTGAMYRCVVLAGLMNKVDWNEPSQLESLASQIESRMQAERVWLNGVDVSAEIRSPEVTNLVHFAADNFAIRRRLVELQRQFAVGRSLVTEGRDQGTVAFPNAECKFFLTASPAERARRRFVELRARGADVTLGDVLAQQNLRDERDGNRDVGALRPAEDAIQICSDGLSPEMVIDRLEQIARAHHHG